MCNYCDSKLNIPCKKSIFNLLIDFGFLGKSSVQAYIKEYETNAYLDMSIDSNRFYGSTLRKSIEINFCPMCGRSLT